MPVATETRKSPRVYSMPNDDKIWAMFASYLFVTVKQAHAILGCKFDYINVRMRRLANNGYLDRVQKNDYAEFVYYLTEKGGTLACERGHLPEPRYVQKKSPMTLDHDWTITDFHMRLAKELPTLQWQQWRGDLAKQFDDIPDALINIGDGWSPFEYVRSYESGYKKGESSLVEKLKRYDKQFKRSYVVMPTIKRVEMFLAKIEDVMPTTRLWFTSEEMYRKDIMGKIWWTPKNFRERVYSLLRPEG